MHVAKGPDAVPGFICRRAVSNRLSIVLSIGGRGGGLSGHAILLMVVVVFGLGTVPFDIPRFLEWLELLVVCWLSVVLLLADSFPGRPIFEQTQSTMVVRTCLTLVVVDDVFVVAFCCSFRVSISLLLEVVLGSRSFYVILRVCLILTWIIWHGRHLHV